MARAKARAVAQFIETGRLPIVEERADSSESVGGAADGPLDDNWLREIRERRQQLQQAREKELAKYREFFKAPKLTFEQMDALLATMERAVGQPARFYDDLTSEQPLEESFFGDVGSGLSCAVKIPRYYPARPPTPDQQSAINKLAATYPVVNNLGVNPNDHKYEFCDPSWWPLLKAKFDEAHGNWPAVLDPFVSHSAAHPFVYEGAASTTKIALFSDFGVGQYQTRAIARQLTRLAYPYVFHLGDVYYGGTSQEFAQNYAGPLDPLMNVSKLFSIPENHELYGKGTAYLAFLAKERASGRVIQDGSYFCVNFPKHKIVAIDVNWNGRQRFIHQPSRDWLKQVLKDDDRTTILLTGSSPFTYGSDQPSQLYKDLLEEFVETYSFDMWFWGDEHYCTLFQRHDSRAPFIASCIGHGGYPGDIQAQNPGLDQKSFVQPVWVETEPRFPKATGLRQDLTNNGWVELTLRDDGGVNLLYVDWLGAKRYAANYRLDPGSNANLNVRSLNLEQGKDLGRATLHNP